VADSVLTPPINLEVDPDVKLTHALVDGEVE
jgi:hypothetical protein